MRVLHLSSPHSWRGGEQQIAYLVEELQKQGVEQWVACPRGSEMADYCAKRQIPTLLYKKRFSVNPLVARMIAQFCHEQRIDLVHAHDSHAHTFGVMAATFFGNSRPLVVHRRVDFPIGKSWLSNWKYNHRAVSQIVCVSGFIEQVVQAGLHRSIPTTVIYSGVDTQRFAQGPQGNIRAELGLPEECTLVGNVAALAPHKDYPTFVRTAALLLTERPDFHFLLIGGDGGEQQRIEALIEELGLGGNLHLLGFRRDIPSLLPQLDVFLFTSKTEGLGTSIIDAFLAQVPVVATRAGGIPELVQHQKTGLLAPVGEAEQLAQLVLDTCQNEEASQARIQAALARAQTHSKEQMGEKTLALYETILLR